MDWLLDCPIPKERRPRRSGKTVGFATIGRLAVLAGQKASLIQGAGMRLRAVLLLPFTAVAVSCDPQVDATYQGEPLITLHGQVKSSGQLPPLDAAMLWQRGPPPSSGDTELATRAPVQSGFPATFTLHLYVPPPAAARRALAPGEVVYARANAGAVVPGTTIGWGAPAGPASTGGGMDANHWVVYLASDVPPRSLTEWWLGAALPAGFHLLRVAPFDGRCIKPADLEACAADLTSRGAQDDGTDAPGMARSYCRAPYRLSLAPPGEDLVLDLAPPSSAGGGACPP
jgi:hypothetical protein